MINYDAFLKRRREHRDSGRKETLVYLCTRYCVMKRTAFFSFFRFFLVGIILIAADRSEGFIYLGVLQANWSVVKSAVVADAVFG